MINFTNCLDKLKFVLKCKYLYLFNLKKEIQIYAYYLFYCFPVQTGYEPRILIIYTSLLKDSMAS